MRGIKQVACLNAHWKCFQALEVIAFDGRYVITAVEKSTIQLLYAFEKHLQSSQHDSRQDLHLTRNLLFSSFWDSTSFFGVFSMNYFAAIHDTLHKLSQRYFWVEKQYSGCEFLVHLPLFLISVNFAVTIVHIMS